MTEEQILAELSALIKIAKKNPEAVADAIDRVIGLFPSGQPEVPAAGAEL